MPAPISTDLRVRVISAYEAGDGGYRVISKRFSIDPKTVYRWIKRKFKTGNVEPTIARGSIPPLICDADLPVLMNLVQQEPDLTAEEYAQRWANVAGINVSRSTMVRALRRLGLSSKKKTLRATEQDRPAVQAARAEFRAKIATIDPTKCVFIDEAGSNLAMTSAMARSPVGERAPYARPGNRGVNVSMLGAVTIEGMSAFDAVGGGVDGDYFIGFIKGKVVPTLRPGDMVFMDNVKFHKRREIQEHIEGAGAELVFIPPYSPEFNPIEEAWSLFKGVLKKAEARTISDLVYAFEKAKLAVTSIKMIGYISHAGYGLPA